MPRDDLNDAVRALLHSLERELEIGDEDAARELLQRTSRLRWDVFHGFPPGFTAVIDWLVDIVGDYHSALREFHDDDGQATETWKNDLLDLLDELAEHEPESLPLGSIGLRQAAVTAADALGLSVPEPFGDYLPRVMPDVPAQARDQFILECLEIGLLVQWMVSRVVNFARDPVGDFDDYNPEKAQPRTETELTWQPWLDDLTAEDGDTLAEEFFNATIAVTGTSIVMTLTDYVARFGLSALEDLTLLECQGFSAPWSRAE